MIYRYILRMLYPETLFSQYIGGMLKPMIQDVADTGIRNYHLAEEMPELWYMDTHVLIPCERCWQGNESNWVQVSVAAVTIETEELSLKPKGNGRTFTGNNHDQ